MPPRRMRLLRIWIWCSGSIFGTPVMSAASAIDDISRIAAATRQVENFIGGPGAMGSLYQCAILAVPSTLRYRGARIASGEWRSSKARSLLPIRYSLFRHSPPPPPHHCLSCQRQPHQHEGRGDLGAAHQNPCRRLHLVPFIGAERAMPAAFAEMADDAMQRRNHHRGIGAEMAQGNERQRRIEGVHLAGDQFTLHIAEHPAAHEIEGAVPIDRAS